VSLIFKSKIVNYLVQDVKLRKIL